MENTMNPVILKTILLTLGNYGWYRLQWYPHSGYWNGQYHPGTMVKFSHCCGDGCCSWSDDHFLEQTEYKNLTDFFTEYPSGEEYRLSDDPSSQD